MKSILVVIVIMFLAFGQGLENGYCSSESCSDEDNDEYSNMAFIKGGVYTMRTDVPIFVADGEAPARRVHISNFLMDKYEVSNAEFAEFVSATSHTTEAETFGDSFVMDKYLSPETL